MGHRTWITAIGLLCTAACDQRDGPRPTMVPAGPGAAEVAGATSGPFVVYAPAAPVASALPAVPTPSALPTVAMPAPPAAPFPSSFPFPLPSAVARGACITVQRCCEAMATMGGAAASAGDCAQVGVLTALGSDGEFLCEQIAVGMRELARAAPSLPAACR